MASQVYRGAFFLSMRPDIFRKYAMFPVRLLIVLMGLLLSLAVVATGKSWQEEWNQMSFRAYLLEGKNWNAAGF